MKLNDKIYVVSPFGKSFGKIIGETPKKWIARINLVKNSFVQDLELWFDKDTLTFCIMGINMKLIK